MAELLQSIERLRRELERHRRTGLKEIPTRTIFIDPLLKALGWDVCDTEAVQLEYPTIDGKSVDYALRIQGKPVLLLEAKQLNDPLDDVKSVTQVVGYAANNGIEWCVLTNGVRYRVYKATEHAAAPEKLMFEVSIDPQEQDALDKEKLAERLQRLSRDSLERGVLNELGEEIFTTSKVRRALDHLCSEPPHTLVRLIRRAIADDSITPTAVKSALARISHIEPAERPAAGKVISSSPTKRASLRARGQYSESHHIDRNPKEVIELYRALDRLCHGFAPGQVAKRYLAKYVSWSIDKRVFCNAHLQQARMRVWLKLPPSEIRASDTFARDVSRVGHWGSGDVELAIDSQATLRQAEAMIRSSFDRACRRQ